ncbi:hypothetical protein B0A52_00314 [Exophiala mesophila]|uniref:Uncharacterized protein n=1 Tax=Exophiala mesophila TaxID=212818 RepID=A0A438NJP0_EXOME|nr:hypothetical protein B0A52_00314 [Exophiala mesophila]
MEHLFPYPKMGSSFLEILQDQLTRKLLGFEAIHAEDISFISGVTSRLKFLLQDQTNHLPFLKIGYTALEAFLQANATGPPLDFNSEHSVFPDTYRRQGLESLKNELLQSLTIDGIAPYSLTPHIELFWLAKIILSNPILAEAGFNGRRARFRVNYWHQKLLAEASSSLHDQLYTDGDVLHHQLQSRLTFGGAAAEEHFVEFLVERAVIRTHYADGALARQDLALAATTRHFQFILTGALGKRTKYQNRDLSQLVVLAKSRDHEPEPYSSRKSSRAEGMDSRKGSADTDSRSNSHSRPLSNRPKSPIMPSSPPPPSTSTTSLRPTTPTSPTRSRDLHEHLSPLANPPTQPEDLPLNDDTLLERIQFKATLAPVHADTLTNVVSPDSALPPQLAALDPANQPLLFPMDSIILLATASSISNTSPADGLVREETLPYATRVLDGGSSNWQVYTQALLVRSRIEGYKSRTTERGLLQLQALVDQVIAETSETSDASPATSEPPTDDPSHSKSSDIKLSAPASSPTSAPTTFLPKASSKESASVAERLRFIYQISPPYRWELEAELAARWTSMGGLKTALEIYERLQMHAEVALCLAATDREADAIKLIKDLVFEQVTSPDNSTAPEDDTKTLKLRSPLPPDTPRLLSILGDITSLPSYYTLAWNASGNRYARSQRSLGRHYAKQRDFPSAAESYKLALGVSKLDRSSWFSLGCVQLELEDFAGAVESFTRCVQLEDDDGESWSNLAIALLKLPTPLVPEDTSSKSNILRYDDEEEGHSPDPLQNSIPAAPNPYANTYAALRALRRAAGLKRDDARIWDNYLTVAASIPPSAGTPWGEIIQAMSRVVELRGKREGEGAIDIKILQVLVRYITDGFPYPSGDGEESEEKDNSAPTSATKQLPHVPWSLLQLIDTQITPLATSNPELYTILSHVSQWRLRPSQSLSQAEKSWRLTLTAISLSEEFDNVSESLWNRAVDKTIWMIERYRDLGPLERERTGGLVEAKWRFKARTAGRRVLGRAKAWEGSEGWKRLTDVLEAIKE